MSYGYLKIKWFGRFAFLLCVVAACRLSASAQSRKHFYYDMQNMLLNTLSPHDTTYIIKLIKKGDAQFSFSADSALSLYQQAWEKSRQINYEYGISFALAKIGSTYAHRHLYEKAMAAFRESLICATLSKERDALLPYIYELIGQMYLSQGQYEAAAKYLFFIAVHTDKQQDFRKKSILYINLTALFSYFPQPYQSSALKQMDYYSLQAEKYARQSGDSDVLAIALMNRGHLYMLGKDWGKSRHYLNEALRLSLKYNMKQLHYNTLLTIGEMYIACNRPEQALTYLRRLRGISRGINPYPQIHEAMLLGKAWYMLKKYPLAEREFILTRKRADQLQLPCPAVDSLFSDLYTAMGQDRKALLFYRASVRKRDSVLNRQQAESIRRLEIRSRIIQKDNELVQKQLMINGQQRELERKSFLVSGSIAGTLILAMLLLVLYRSYRHKQKFQQERIRSLQKEKEIDRLKAMMTGEEKERERIARELHDGIGGMLAAINMHFNVAEKKYHGFGEMNELTQIMQMLEGMADEVRKTAHNLMPSILLQHNLAEALQLYIAQVGVNNRLHIDLHLPETISIREKNIELILFRMIQELIQNIIKHAHATHVIIDIEELQEHLILTVEDNGIGFSKDENRNGVGLQNLQFRVKALQGTLRIDSEKNSGTTVQIKFDRSKL